MVVRSRALEQNPQSALHGVRKAAPSRRLFLPGHPGACPEARLGCAGPVRVLRVPRVLLGLLRLLDVLRRAHPAPHRRRDLPRVSLVRCEH